MSQLDEAIQDAPQRLVTVASADLIKERFCGDAWGEHHSGSYLASKFTEGPFSKLASEERPAVGVFVAIELALYDYAESLGAPEPIKSTMAVAMNMRIGEIASLLAADDESAKILQDAYAVIHGADIGPDEPTPPRVDGLGL